MPIETNFDVPFVASLALREKQIQQNYRPYIAVHKWFARRPGTLFRALILSEFVDRPIRETFFQSHNLRGVRIGDPFMGGGTTLVEANRLGCDIVGYDINPMAYWIVRQEIDYLELDAYKKAANELLEELESEVGSFYQTTCPRCGSKEARVKYFLWVKVQTCKYCGKDVDLFPGYILALNHRHPNYVLVCPKCGHLNEVKNINSPGYCASCGAPLRVDGVAKRNQFVCPHCGATNTYPDPNSGPPRHRLFAIEYYCEECKLHYKGRFFKVPDEEDLQKYQEAAKRWGALTPQFVPDEEIPVGDETERLRRWGYRYYKDLFNARQLLGLELSAQIIARLEDVRVRNALATNLSDLLRYQNMLCRYDTAALKSLDIFSIHGFPVGLIQCESNLLGIRTASGVNIGSGGWTNIIDKFVKAKQYCERPFEVHYEGKRKHIVHIAGEWIGTEHPKLSPGEKRAVHLACKNAIESTLPPGSLDAVLTDPPYFGNVQYAELMDFNYVWLRRLLASYEPCFTRPSTRSEHELTGNVTMKRGLDHFTEGLSEVFQRMAVALKPSAPMAFTYHHNRLEAYYPLVVAILDAGLIPTACFPCPSEMGASIHISGTRSSVVDTIFVCRHSKVVLNSLTPYTIESFKKAIEKDLVQLRKGGLKPTEGDALCIAYGHLTRWAILRFQGCWDRGIPVSEKLRLVEAEVKALLSAEKIKPLIADVLKSTDALYYHDVGTGRSLV